MSKAVYRGQIVAKVYLNKKRRSVSRALYYTPKEERMTERRQRFDKKVVIVTGAGSGIGKATAHRFLDEGANVVFVGRHRDKLETASSAFPHDRVLVVEADVSSEADVENFVKQTLERFGDLNVLINNAGVHAEGTVDELATDDWQNVMKTDLVGISSRAGQHFLTSNLLAALSSTSRRFLELVSIGQWLPTTLPKAAW